MTAKNKIKGNNFEKEVVKLLTTETSYAKRAWGSNGKSFGEHEEVDILFNYQNGQFDRSYPEPNPYYDTLKVQCKKRKEIPKFLGLTEHVDCTIFKENRGTCYIMFRLEDFLKRFV